VPRAAEQPHQRRGERGADRRQRAADGERQPERLGGDLAGVRLPAGAVQPRDVGGRGVGEEVAQCDDGRQQRSGERERRELRRAEMADDRRVGEQVQRLGGERAEGGKGQAQDLAVVDGAAQQGPDSTIRP
jgi:hypothetical protein